MKELHRIIAACDLSVYSEPVLDCAAYLAQKLNAELTVVHVINQRDIDALMEAVHKIVPEESELTLSMKEYVESIRQERIAEIDKMIAKTSMAGRNIRKIFRIGIPYQEIIDVSRSENADLLVMGSKGKGNITGMLFGSTAERVFRLSPIPVLSARLGKSP